MLTRPRKVAHPENLTRTFRTLRGNTWFWCDKKVTRFFRKNFSKKHYNNLRCVYLALCEIDSDFHEGTAIRGFKNTLCTYAGKSIEIITKYFYFLEQLQLVTAHQTKQSNGRFGKTHLYISAIEDQLDEYFADPEWWNAILESENLNLGKGYNIAKWTINPERLTAFPVNGNTSEPENPGHKKNCSDNENNVSNEITNCGPSSTSYDSTYDDMDDVDDSIDDSQYDAMETSALENTHIHQTTSIIDASIMDMYQENKEAQEHKAIQETQPTPVIPIKKVKKELSKKQLCFKERADKLADIITTSKKINKNASVHMWYKEIEKLYESDGVSLKRIDTVLDWYAVNIGTSQWIPVAESARSFREKFTRFEDAIWRQAESKKSTSPARSVEEYNNKMNSTTSTTNSYRIKPGECVYYHTTNDGDDIRISFEEAVELLKSGKGSPHELVDDWFAQIKEQEGL